ncbi:hypothetical protein [Lentilactobacillus kosonis]|uniref:DUF4649 domain-containing protein n=1 Tax=Lentilactobacillus kosonis TaxID=2810561 RepID=A0A401FNL8_9LACO|nr:hypothetical protein [Lentilactobacillus kosonis]GAY73906.1 hypothetical protein NBRC111893_2052 [Lentilactobacillus kosonis]
MLEITYKNGSSLSKISYNSVEDFIANQRLETPDLEDYYEITSVTIDGKELQLSDSTILGLYKQLTA